MLLECPLAPVCSPLPMTFSLPSRQFMLPLDYSTRSISVSQSQITSLFTFSIWICFLLLGVTQNNFSLTDTSLNPHLNPLSGLRWGSYHQLVLSSISQVHLGPLKLTACKITPKNQKVDYLFNNNSYYYLLICLPLLGFKPMRAGILFALFTAIPPAATR